MEVVTIQKEQLKTLIKETIEQSLSEYLPKLDLMFKDEWGKEVEARINAYDKNKIKSVAQDQVFSEYEA